MIYITNLVYILPGSESIFEEYESIVIPVISRYGGRMLLRIRPDKPSVIQALVEVPHEIHFVEFPSDDDFQNFLKDEERKKFMYLKEKTIRSNFMTKGLPLQ